MVGSRVWEVVDACRFSRPIMSAQMLTSWRREKRGGTGERKMFHNCEKHKTITMDVAKASSPNNVAYSQHQLHSPDGGTGKLFVSPSTHNSPEFWYKRICITRSSLLSMMATHWNHFGIISRTKLRVALPVNVRLNLIARISDDDEVRWFLECMRYAHAAEASLQGREAESNTYVQLHLHHNSQCNALQAHVNVTRRLKMLVHPTMQSRIP